MKLVSSLLIFFTVSSVSLGSEFFYELKLQFPELKSPEFAKLKNHDLFEMKQFESKKNWAACAALGKKNFDKNEKIKDWVLLSWLLCSRKEFETKKTDLAKSQLHLALASLDKNKPFMLLGTARNQIFNEMIKARIALAEQQVVLLGKTNNKKFIIYFVKNLDALAEYASVLEKDTKSRMYFFYSEVAQAQHNLVAARQFLELSLAEKESSAALEKYASVRLVLGDKENGNKDRTSELPISEEEKKIEDRIEQSLTKSDLINLLEDGVSYLNDFPSGRKSKFINEKILEVLGQFFERQNKPEERNKYTELRERAFLALEKADVSKQLDWAKSLHKKGDFQASLRLLEKSYFSISRSAQGAIALWVLGRSAQFLGLYSQAQKYFEEYLKHHPAGEEASEVMFRLALVHIRQSHFSSAIATLEKVLIKKSADKFDLSARYWLIRALQSEGNSRADLEISALLEKYPFSYYGLRLRGEKNNNVIEIPELAKQSLDISKSLFQTQEIKKQFEKIEILMANEWLVETQKEINSIPTPKDSLVKILLAKKWAEGQAFPTVIKLTNEALELDTGVRNFDLIQTSYPTIFAEQIQKEATKNKLSPLLVRSLIRQESAFGPTMVSSSNAMGLMQMIPQTALEIAQDLKIPKFNVEDTYDPDLNIQMGTYYIARMIRKFGGNVPLGLAAYNAGPHKVQLYIQARSEVQLMTQYFSSKPLDEIWIDEIPWSETSIYVKSILRNILMYQVLEHEKVSLSEVIWSGLAETAEKTAE